MNGIVIKYEQIIIDNTFGAIESEYGIPLRGSMSEKITKQLTELKNVEHSGLLFHFFPLENTQVTYQKLIHIDKEILKIKSLEFIKFESKIFMLENNSESDLIILKNFDIKIVFNQEQEYIEGINKVLSKFLKTGEAKV